MHSVSHNRLRSLFSTGYRTGCRKLTQHGIAGHVKVKDSTTIVTDDGKAVQSAEGRVGTVKKSIAAIASRWFRKKVSHRFAGSGGLGAHRTHRDTVGSDKSKPSISNSP